ncbi:MAG: hypothetical protein ABI831_25440 [Betaproteobacteria bacterium]
MTSARDLLLQADALMRSNRNVGATDSDTSVPLLTDVTLPGGEGVSQAQHLGSIPVLTNAVDLRLYGVPIDLRLPDSSIQFPTPSILGEAPVVRESVMPASAIRNSYDVEAGIQSIQAADVLQFDPFPIERHQVPPMPPEAPGVVRDPSPPQPLLSTEEMLPHMPLPPVPEASGVASAASPPEPLLSAEEMLPPMPLPPPLPEASRVGSDPSPAAPPLSAEEMLPPMPRPPIPADAPVPGAQSAAELAESVYYQVLQNLDLFTEQALQRELTAHLGPIIERANHELLATLHANLGGLLRQFIAEAIEKQLGVRPDTHETP